MNSCPQPDFRRSDNNTGIQDRGRDRETDGGKKKERVKEMNLYQQRGKWLLGEGLQEYYKDITPTRPLQPALSMHLSAYADLHTLDSIITNYIIYIYPYRMCSTVRNNINKKLNLRVLTYSKGRGRERWR